MIRLNVEITVNDDEQFKRIFLLATELTELSLHEKGNIDYDFYQSTTNDDRLLIVETWRDDDALLSHEASEHYRRIVPELHELAAVTVERFDF